MKLFSWKKDEVLTEEKERQSYLKFFHWIQEFSKKIITITFVIYVLIHIFILAFVAIAYFRTGDIASLDTLITESNTTFRDVIGGYIIKAATENAIKIAGGIIDHYLELKYRTNKEEGELYGEETDCS